MLVVYGARHNRVHKSSFSTAHFKREAGVLKNLHSGSVFEKAVYMWMEARMEKKVSVFKTIRIQVMWIGPQSLSTTVLFSTLIPTIIITVGCI